MRKTLTKEDTTRVIFISNLRISCHVMSTKFFGRIKNVILDRDPLSELVRGTTGHFVFHLAEDIKR